MTASTSPTADTAPDAHADTREIVNGLTDSQRKLALHFLAGFDRAAFNAAVDFATDPVA